MTTSSGDFGEQGDYATDGQLDDVLSNLGLGDSGAPPPSGGVQPDDVSPIPGGGKLLEEPDDGKVYKAVDDLVMRQERLDRNRAEKKKHYRHVRAGMPLVFLEKSDDRSVFKASVTLGVDDGGVQSVPNKMDDLCNKIISQILADDYLPNPKPDGDADSDRGAADLAKKFLRSDGTVTGTDDKALLRDMLNWNISDACAGVFVWVDPTAGGWRPKQLMAHPRAEDASKPMYAPRLDPTTGQPIQTQLGPIMEKASAPVLRYVAELPHPLDPKLPAQRVFTENAAEAMREWLPKHRRKLLNINQIRCVPQSADVFTASSITLLLYDTLDEAKKRFQVLGTLDDTTLKAVLAWRPKRWKEIVPDAHRPKDEGATTVSGDSLVFWYEHLCRIAPDYQDGAQIAVNGAAIKGSGESRGFVLLRDTLREDVETDDGKKTPILMPPPVSQFSCTSDIEDNDPFGMAALSRFGGGKGAWDSIWLGLLEAMHKALNRNVFIPSTSTVTREDINRRDGTPIEIFVAADKPEYEEVAEVPVFVPDMLEKLELQLNSAAGTNETSNGLDSTYSESGIAKQIAIKTARTALAQYWQNTVKGLTHYWHIKTKLAQAKLTVPQMVRLTGVESAYKQPWFVGSDLCGVSEIALEPGSGSMMQPSEKAQHLSFLQANRWIDLEQAGELARASMTDDLGLPPNIHEEAINREIGAWSKGPPPGWMQQQQLYEQNMAAVQQTLAPLVQPLVAAGADPQAAQQAAMQQLQAQGIPIPQPPPSPFVPLPNHQEQLVAVVRHRALSRMMSTVEYAKQPPQWQALFNPVYEQARQAAGIPTVAEQQAAAQQQADAAQQDAKGQADAKSQEQDKKLQADAHQKEQDRVAQSEQHARTAMSNEAIAATKTAPPRAGAPRAAAPLPS